MFLHSSENPSAIYFGPYLGQGSSLAGRVLFTT